MKIQQTNFIVPDTTANYYSNGTLFRPFVKYLDSIVEKPVFGAVLLNAQFALIKNVELSQGDLNLELQTNLLNEIYANNAQSVVFYHNIGNSLVSNLSIIKQFRRTLSELNVKTLDYIVIDEKHYHSTNIDEIYCDKPDTQIFIKANDDFQQPLLLDVSSFFGDEMTVEKITPLRQVA